MASHRITLVFIIFSVVSCQFFVTQDFDPMSNEILKRAFENFKQKNPEETEPKQVRSVLQSPNKKLQSMMSSSLYKSPVRPNLRRLVNTMIRLRTF